MNIFLLRGISQLTKEASPEQLLISLLLFIVAIVVVVYGGDWLFRRIEPK